MIEYIRRDKMLAAMIEYFKCSTINETYIKAVLYCVPNEDVKPVDRGCWMYMDTTDEDDWVGYVCSECGNASPDEDNLDFCPFCGADMRKEDQDEQAV